ncbi:bcl-2/adenovirus E1B 19 kDa-interacting protein 2-like protein isoform X3 [Xenopus tropicalis]|uniref:Bcl-2/adenovirus E1B 19 kDa-interacting protein 2-like protein n=1 Tax=Xenopus tropicalis TaxID=8364 RepID=A0A8J1INH9_XENTR|nr:bcl-2/adenovirus E1B 19 kDa-interacting protein 2-like protein isoform X3 [Xenopus tropicalis]
MGTYLEGHEKLQQDSGSSKCYGPQASAPTGIDDMELKEEWQDEDFPRPLPEAVTEEELESSEYSQSASTPNTIELCGNRHLKKRLSAPSINFNLENSGESIASSEQAEQSTEDLDFDIDDLETPNSSELLDCPEFEWDGYYGEGLNAVIVFASCYLPQDSIPDYQYVLNNLFRYIIGTLDLMVADDYMLVYLNGATPRCKIPPISWIKRCYQATGRRLKKNLKSVLILHPTWYVKALLAITRPFISSKFWKKVKFMSSIEDLSLEVSLEQIHIPDCIRELDKELNS